MTEDAVTPADYPHDDWDKPGGDYYVPEALRRFYAAAQPRDEEISGYIQSGAAIAVEEPTDKPRALPTHGDHPPSVFHQQDTITQLRTLSGAKDYRLWLHVTRLRIAHYQAKAAARGGPAQPVCQSCGKQYPGVVQTSDFFLPGAASYMYAGGRYQAMVCGTCMPLVAEAVRARALDALAGQTIDDGRTRGEAAAALANQITDRAMETSR